MINMVTKLIQMFMNDLTDSPPKNDFISSMVEIRSRYSPF
ncbi:hypothetical protein JCM19236_187 [Vibrio sp. JCM 19236]|nr:hypothetical protein JCM19236_187 [Vibrio sp. JCM 19236]